MAKYQYPRKTIYFKADNIDLYNYLETMGKQSSEYICKLIRADMERDDKDTEQLILEEIQRLREDLKHVRTETPLPVKDESQREDTREHQEIEVNDAFGDLLL